MPQKLSHKSRRASPSLPPSLCLFGLAEVLLMSISLLLFSSLNSQNADVRVASPAPELCIHGTCRPACAYIHMFAWYLRSLFADHLLNSFSSAVFLLTRAI